MYDTPRADYRWENDTVMGVHVDLSPDTAYTEINAVYNEVRDAVEIRCQYTRNGYRVPLTGVDDLHVEELDQEFNNGVLSMYLDIRQRD